MDSATGGIREIVRCTQRVGDIMTIVRGQEGTDPVAWGAGDIVTMLLTAGTMDNMIQIPQAQAQTFKFAQDTGTVNGVVVALSPAVTTRIPGLEINVKIAANNTGASTLNLGAGSIQIVNPDGSDLGAGALVAGGVATFIDTGSGPYQLTSYSQQAQAAAGAATTGDFSWRPTTETKIGWVVANSGTIGNALSGSSNRANADCANLFAWHWNNFSNTQCPVFDSSGNPVSRGVNAAADFAANRCIRTIDMRGVAMLGMDNMGTLLSTYYAGVPVVFGNAQTAGSIIGESLHTLTIAELAAHSHGVTDPGHTHTFNNNPVISGQQTGTPQGGGSSPAPTNPQTTTIVANTTGISIQNNGSNSPHNTVDRGMVGTMYIKL
ncbi:hypothetical protein A1D31_11815 [Bradyrhizobium liaoningense]|nr:hypothetical protein A1D31_11815 [Bradyrhizobium liaoningense]